MTRSIHDTAQMVPAPSSHLNSTEWTSVSPRTAKKKSDVKISSTLWGGEKTEGSFARGLRRAFISKHMSILFLLQLKMSSEYWQAPTSCVFSLPRRNNSWLLSTSDTSRQNIGRYNSFIKPEIYSKIESKPSSSMSAISYHRKLGNSNTGVNKTVKYALSPISQHPYSQCWLIFHWAVHSWI